MAKTLQFRRGTTAELSSITGAVGELFVDTTKEVVVVSDGVTAGGFPLQSELVSNVNIKTINGTSVLGSGDITISGGDYGNANVAAYLPTYTGNLVSLTGNVTTTANISGSFFIGNGSQLTGLPESYTNSNVAAYLPTYTGNLVSLEGNVTTTANISGNYILGNGSQLTGLPESYTNSNVAAYLPTYTGNLASLTGNVTTTANISGAFFIGNGSQLTGVTASADLSEISEDVTPMFSGVYDIGSADKRWYNGYFSNGVDVNGSVISAENGVLNTVSDLVVGSVLTDELLLSNNLITPDDSTARQYLGDKGVVVIDGNLDVEGDWMQISVVETREIIGGTWSAAASLNQSRLALASVGSQDAALAIGGQGQFGGGRSSTEIYNGVSWTVGSDLQNGTKNLAGVGTQDAALAIGGVQGPGPSANTEEYNGTSWTAGGSLLTARADLAGAGTQDAALAFGGQSDSLGILSSTEEYNGVAWSSGLDLPIVVSDLAGAGTQDAALAIGGQGTGPEYFFRAVAYEYNGTSWTAGGSLLTPRADLAGAGTQDAALAIGGGIRAGGGGGDLTPVNTVEIYNGTTWSTTNSMSTVRSQPGGNGLSSAALAVAGTSTSSGLKVPLTSVEQFLQETILPPTAGDDGMIRFNRDINEYQKYQNGSWKTWSSVDVVDSPSTDGFIGQLRFNRSTGTFEGYNGSEWVSLS